MPAKLFAVKQAEVEVTTILGSCVSVCIYDEKNKVFGINHYLLPFYNIQDPQTLKYGDAAINELIEEMIKIGGDLNYFAAKVFGGANVLDIQDNSFKIGQKNIEIAFKLLEKFNIKLLNFDVEGIYGRKIIANSNNFEIKLKRIIKSNGRSVCETNRFENYS
ncbi:MAG: chemotaxis protein CheD [Thermoplasmata archaeon]